MNILRFPRQIAHGILATLLLAACTGNELTDGNLEGTPLPEGRTPLPSPPRKAPPPRSLF